MSFFKPKKTENHQFEELFTKPDLPLLLSYEPFKNMIKFGISPKMKKEMGNLEELLKEEKKYILEVNSLHKEKSRITATILYLSNQLNEKNSPTSAKELEMRKNRMQEIIVEIKAREAEIQELRLKQEDQNLVLLRDTVEYAYEYMKKDEKDLEAILEEIERQRKKLEKDREKRDTLKLRLDSMYGFMHAMMGAKETEKLDSEFFEDEQS